MSGIYIHIPFCAKRCSYCDFHFATTFESYRSELLAEMNKEIALRSKDSKVAIETIYFGGGTPSLLTVNEINQLIKSVKTNYNVTQNTEVTLECNPDNASIENLQAWKKLGINRLSMGIQSFEEHQLEWMNRTHSASEGKKAILNAKEVGFTALTVDLMYGLPDLSLEQWKHQLEELIALDIPHISAYCLTIEERTPLANWVQKGIIHPPSADQQSEQFILLVELLEKAGYEQYEISNFAKNNAYSKHNTAYWQGKTYIGIGPSAHGYTGTERYWNIANNTTYTRSLQNGKIDETREELSPNDQFNELIMIGLRTQWGVNKQQLFQLIKPGKNWFEQVLNWKNSNDLIETETEFVLTKKGRLLADHIASELFILGDSSH